VRPPEDDHSASEDQLLAQVIPLRRRVGGADEDAELSPITPHGQLPTGVFDPPQDPEPAEGYSVWEQPIAELIRRGEPEPTRKRPPRPATQFARAPRVLLVAALGVVSCVLVLTLSGWLARPRSAPLRAPSRDHAGVGKAHAIASSSMPLRARRGPPRHTTPPSHWSKSKHGHNTRSSAPSEARASGDATTQPPDTGPASTGAENDGFQAR